MSPTSEKIVNKKKGNNIDKFSGILPLIPKELNIKFM